MKAARQPGRRAKKLEKRRGGSVDTTEVQKSRKITSQEKKALDTAHIEGLTTNLFCFMFCVLFKLISPNFMPLFWENYYVLN